MASRKTIIWSAAGVLLLVSFYALNRERIAVGGIRNLFSRAYWAARINGTNLYAPNARMLKHGNPHLHEIAITIDDGPHPLSCGPILDVLKKEGVHATFFPVGVKVKQRPDLVRRMVDEGNEVGNHTQDHLRLTTLRPDQMQKEIDFAERNFNKATGRHLYLLRPPGMNFDDEVLKIVKNMGYVMVNWTSAAKDFISLTHEHPVDPKVIADRVVGEADDGGIILIHDAPDTAAALPTIIDRLKEKGYKFVTISEMLADLPDPVHIKSNAGPYAPGELAKLEKSDPVPAPHKMVLGSEGPAHSVPGSSASKTAARSGASEGRPALSTVSPGQ